jgi:hypothetical protein
MLEKASVDLVGHSVGIALVIENVMTVSLLDEVHHHLDCIENVLGVALLKEVGKLHAEASCLRFVECANTSPILAQATSPKFSAKDHARFRKTVHAFCSKGAVLWDGALVDSLPSIVQGVKNLHSKSVGNFVVLEDVRRCPLRSLLPPREYIEYSHSGFLSACRQKFLPGP